MGGNAVDEGADGAGRGIVIDDQGARSATEAVDAVGARRQVGGGVGGVGGHAA